MAVYLRRIAVLKQLNGGFSADGGEVSGVARAEQYGDKVFLEVSLINFAPIEEGRYVCAFCCDGKVEFFERTDAHTFGNVSVQNGFAFGVFFVRGNVVPVAFASCGEEKTNVDNLTKRLFNQENPPLQEEVKEKSSEKKESESATGKIEYSDEAIAEDNYYEYESGKNDNAPFENSAKEQEGQNVFKDEKNNARSKESESGVKAFAEGKFYELVMSEVEQILKENDKEGELESLIENSRWAKISYGNENHYVFGVVYEKENPLYFCYGVPSNDDKNCPQSMDGLGVYIPTKAGGYWVMYQDAKSGQTIELNKV